MSFKRKSLYAKSTVDSNYPGTVPKVRIYNSPSSSINTAKSLVADSAKRKLLSFMFQNDLYLACSGLHCSTNTTIIAFNKLL